MQLVRRDVPVEEGSEKRKISLLGKAAANPEWFNDADPGPAMVAFARNVTNQQSWRRSQNLRLARLYQDRDIASIYGVAGSAAGAAMDALTDQRSSWNIVRAACDVAQARVGKNRGRVMFVSVNGDWGLRRKAKLRTRFVDGAFRQADFYAESQKVFLDGAVFGIGILYVYSEGGKLRCERCLPDEVIVEHGQGIHGKPRTAYRRVPMPRSEAIRRYAGSETSKDYAKRVAAIMDAPVSSIVVGMERTFASSDVIDVWQAWHLPSSPKAKDGKYVVAVEGCTIATEAWNRPRLPFAVFRWGTALTGWYGLGIAEQLRGTQLKIRRLQWQISTAEYHVATPKILAAHGSKLNVKHLNNDARGTVVWYTGAVPPQWIVPQAVGPELFQDLEREWQHGFDQVGLPPSGSGVIPANLKSGEAIRMYTEGVDSRLAVPSQRWDQYAVDAAEVFLDEVREVGDVVVESQVRRAYDRLSWKEIAGEGSDDDFVLQPWPTSILPATPSGKFDRLQEMEQAGWINKEQAMAALEVPDLENIIGLSVSSYELVGMQLERMLDEGKPERPEPYQDLDQALKIAQAAAVRARCDGAPEDRLQLVLDYIDAVRALQPQAPPPQPAPPDMAGGPPQPAAGAPAPTAPPAMPPPGAMAA